jgi:hypothetical protein
MPRAAIATPERAHPQPLSAECARHDLARDLAPGICHAATEYGARLDDQLAQAFDSYQRGLAEQDNSTIHLAQMQADVVNHEMGMQSTLAFQLLRACAPGDVTDSHE